MRCNIKLKKVTGQSIALRRGAFAETKKAEDLMVFCFFSLLSIRLHSTAHRVIHCETAQLAAKCGCSA